MIYLIKRFSEGGGGDSRKENKTSSLETIGKVGLGIGAATGLMSGAHYLGQSWNVKKLLEGNQSGISHSEAMKFANEGSKNISFRDIQKNRDQSLKQLKKDFLNSGYSIDSNVQYKRNTTDIKRSANALQHSKLKRGFGKAALITGGLGALAYGASKLRNKD